jgi:hypothetical protein
MYRAEAADMETGAVLFGVALVCLFLTGPSGPCGPGTVLGVFLLPFGLFSVGLAWLVSTASLLGSLRYRELRSATHVPVLVATPLATVVALLLKRADEPWTAAGLVLFCAWPPTVATVYAIRRRWLRAE